MDQLKPFEVAVREEYYAICTRAAEMITGRPARSVREVYLDHRTLLTSGPD